jgi:hypothetical protein
MAVEALKGEPMEAEEVKNVADLLRWIIDNEKAIYVRVQRDGSWKALSLAQLYSHEYAEKVTGFIIEFARSGWMPVALRGLDDLPQPPGEKP